MLQFQAPGWELSCCVRMKLSLQHAQRTKAETFGERKIARPEGHTVTRCLMRLKSKAVNLNLERYTMAKKRSAAELEFVLDAIKVMEDLNEQIEIIQGAEHGVSAAQKAERDKRSAERKANIEKLKASIKGEIQ
jgi:alpha-D-ribose 1-methylphosphonate 5-triphosphate synthase subunit PhnG